MCARLKMRVETRLDNQGGSRSSLGPKYQVSKHSGMARMARMLVVWTRWLTNELLAIFRRRVRPPLASINGISRYSLFIYSSR